MEVEILGEAGYEFALRGIGKSFGVSDFERLERVAERLAPKDGGHNKFLESLVVWMDVRASRYLWQEFDTYRTGTTKQSESTIHTITKKVITQDDFEDPIDQYIIDLLNSLIHTYNKLQATGTKEQQKACFRRIKNTLPEGYLQSRIVCTNYKVLKNIFAQRKNHALDEWPYFIKEVLRQIKYPEFLSGALD